MARVEKRTLQQIHKQDRGWGCEYWIENIPEYCGKVLVINPRKRGSLHFHANKKETMLVIAGTATLRFIDTETAQEYFVELEVGNSLLIPQGQPHQICNNTDAQVEIIEFSTIHEESDSKRIQKGD